jgi:thymidylate synthase ThyX
MSDNHKGISAQVIADSVHDTSRLTTFEVTFPRFILAEFNTHRMLSRNSASSRAIPVWKRLAEAIDNPFIPLQFGKNKAGMQSAEEVSEEDNQGARENWLVGRNIAVIQAFMLAGGEEQIMKDSRDNLQAIEICKQIKLLAGAYPDVIAKMRTLPVGVHKQHANRVLEPYAWHTVIVTGTAWRNFYALRASKMAQPEIQALAIAMARVHSKSVPRELEAGEWHLPLVNDEDRREISDGLKLARISSARCARVSYLTHEGKRDIEADLKLADRLQESGHMSPFEHPARAPEKGIHHKWLNGGNFSNPWTQYRKMIGNEGDFSNLISPDDFLAGLGGDQKLVDFALSLPE